MIYLESASKNLRLEDVFQNDEFNTTMGNILNREAPL